MRIRSISTRLTLWNVSVLTVILLALLTAVRLTVQSYLISMADRELAFHASQASMSMIDGRQHREGHGPGRPHPPRPALDNRVPPPQPIRLFDISGRELRPPDQGPQPGGGLWDRRSFRESLSGKTIFSIVRADGEPSRVFSSPVVKDGKVVGVVQVAYPLTELHRFLQGLTFIMLVLLPIALLAAGIGGRFLSTRWLHPVRDITQAADQISASDLSRRLDVSGDDEFSRLALTINLMLERLDEAFSRLERSMEQQKRFTADASHELRTPLTTIKANTSLALRQAGTMDDYRKAVLASDHAADVMERLIQDLLMLAESDEGQLVPYTSSVRISDIFGEAVALAGPADGKADLRVEVEDAELRVTGSERHLVRLITNLVDNSLRHTPADGLVRLCARRDGDQVVMQVTDNGEGIAAEHLPHLCERFYRVDKSRARRHGGTGLGLAICQTIVSIHHGDLDISSAPNQGTTVTIRFPLNEPQRTCET